MEPKKSILLIEDDQMIRGLYARTLSASGYAVTEVEDGQAGYDEMMNRNYDLILLDLMLPVLNGSDVLKKVSETKPELTRRIVVLTNLDQDAVKAETMDYNIRGYLVKSQQDVMNLPQILEQYM